MIEVSPCLYVLDQEHKNAIVYEIDCHFCGKIHWWCSLSKLTESEFYGADQLLQETDELDGDEHGSDKLFVHENVDVEILRCRKCGNVSVGWRKTARTKEYILNHPVHVQKE